MEKNIRIFRNPETGETGREINTVGEYAGDEEYWGIERFEMGSATIQSNHTIGGRNIRQSMEELGYTEEVT